MMVYDETLPMEMSARALDLARLRRGFAELFDRAAQAVQLAGYEQDDAVLERYLLVRAADGAEVVVSAEWLADRERLIGHLAVCVDLGRRHQATKGERITNYELRITNAETLRSRKAEKPKRRNGETSKCALGMDLSGISIIGIRVEAVVE